MGVRGLEFDGLGWVVFGFGFVEFWFDLVVVGLGVVCVARVSGWFCMV